MSEKQIAATTPMSFAEIQAMAKYLQGSRLLPGALRGKEVDIAFVIATGQELGLPPTAALRAVRIIDGQPVLSADAMVAIALKSGAAEYFRKVESNEQRAVYETWRKGASASQRGEFRIEDAERAELLGDGDDKDPSWQKHPAAMLRARAKAMLARDVYPDVLMGVYTEDEAREIAPAGDGFQAVPPPASVLAELDEQIEARDLAQHALHAEIARCEGLAQLEALAARIKAVPGLTDREQLSAAYVGRRRELEGAS